MELRNLQVRLPAEQRLAFAKNYSERLQESEKLPFDLLESVRINQLVLLMFFQRFFWKI